MNFLDVLERHELSCNPKNKDLNNVLLNIDKKSKLRELEDSGHLGNRVNTASVSYTAHIFFLWDLPYFRFSIDLCQSLIVLNSHSIAPVKSFSM